jgi:hypothetical protein
METFLDISEDHTTRLLTEIIHKIKNSLGGIGGFAALLERDLGPDDPRADLARRIQTGVMRMNDFVVDLMLYLQNIELGIESVDPVQVIRQAWTEFWDEDTPPADALELPDATASARLDIETFRKMVEHAFHFARLAGGSIDRVRFHFTSETAFAFEVTFPATSNLLVESGPKIQRIKTCEPIEAKLSLYLVIKLAKFNRAKTSLSSHNPGRNVLTVHFNR